MKQFVLKEMKAEARQMISGFLERGMCGEAQGVLDYAHGIGVLTDIEYDRLFNKIGRELENAGRIF